MKWFKELERDCPDAAEDITRFMDRFVTLREQDRIMADRYRQRREDLQAADIEEEDESQRGPTNLPAQRGTVEVAPIVRHLI